MSVCSAGFHHSSLSRPHHLLTDPCRREPARCPGNRDAIRAASASYFLSFFWGVREAAFVCRSGQRLGPGLDTSQTDSLNQTPSRDVKYHTRACNLGHIHTRRHASTHTRPHMRPHNASCLFSCGHHPIPPQRKHTFVSVSRSRIGHATRTNQRMFWQITFFLKTAPPRAARRPCLLFYNEAKSERAEQPAPITFRVRLMWSDIFGNTRSQRIFEASGFRSPSDN